uniref:Uncharacterized protein n=1 Tax=Strombidium inclinatum TaxID=197538 RepID=A0A7S3IKJ5_9SPIT|mmetsp:Transcript_21787/g.33674  ORF Transcript_21787/g.33674 Transcript_21787/m.33674 type:complete len:128 (+) Transcript_21787:942-1325(+)
MKAIEEFFSGAEGTKRSKALIKFVKLLTAEAGAEEPKDKKKVQSSKKESEDDNEEEEPKPKKKAKSVAQKSTSGRITLSHKKRAGSLQSKVKKAAHLPEPEDGPEEEEVKPVHSPSHRKTRHAEFSL